MPWRYIKSLLGPGLHWGKSRAELRAAVEQARADDMPAAAEHLQIILDLRDRVMFDSGEDK